MKKAFFLIFTILAIAPTIASAALVECDICGINDFLGVIPKIFDFIVKSIAVPASVLFLTIGGVVLLISGGQPEMKNLGKKILVTTLIGMFLVFGSWVIVNFILGALGAKTL